MGKEARVPLPPEAEKAYGQWWQLAYSAATSKDDTGRYQFTVTDLVSAAARIARDAGEAISFATSAALGQLFGVARRSGRAIDALAGAGPDQAIDSSMIAEWPTAAGPNIQAAQPRYDVKAQFTYTAATGFEQVSWVTLSGVTQLPETTGLLGLRMQGAAIKAYTTPEGEGGAYLDAELMAEFGSILQMQIFAV